MLIDEVPAIYLHLDKAWKEFIKQLGSEARKVNISCVMLTQSPLVQDIGLNTSMQRNFRSVALDHACIRTLLDRAELNKARREVVAEKMSGQDFPAAVEFSGEVFLLDRSSLEHQRDHDLIQASWQGYELSVRPSASEEVAEIGVFRGCTDGRTRTDGEIVVSDDDKLDLLRAMRADGKTRDQARDTLAMLGVRFENADWTKAGD